MKSKSKRKSKGGKGDGMSNEGKTEQNKEGHPLCTVAPKGKKKGGLPTH